MELIAIGIVAFFAAFLQGAVGVGFGMIMAPAVALIRPDLLPATILLLATVLTLGTWFRERSAIDWKLFGWALIGRMPGTVVGVMLVMYLSSEYLVLMLSFTILAGVVSGFQGWSPTARPRNVLVAGGLSGVLGTATSIGGPPMSLVMRAFQPARIRATLGAYFTVGSMISLVALWLGGSLQENHLVVAMSLLPIVLLGLGLSSFFIHRLSSERLFYTSMFAATLGAVLVIIQSALTLILNLPIIALLGG